MIFGFGLLSLNEAGRELIHNKTNITRFVLFAWYKFAHGFYCETADIICQIQI
jgi:hypothetical protein